MSKRQTWFGIIFVAISAWEIITNIEPSLRQFSVTYNMSMENSMLVLVLFVIATFWIATKGGKKKVSVI